MDLGNDITKSKVEGVHRRSVTRPGSQAFQLFDVDNNCLFNRKQWSCSLRLGVRQ
jgi:hypothetical protein